MIKLKTTLFLLFISVSAFAKTNFTPSVITFKNGEILECLAANFSNVDNYVLIKRGEKSKKEKLKSETISSILVKAKQQTFLLLRKPIYFDNKEKWMILIKECSDFNLMAYLKFFEVNKKGELVMYFSSAYYIIQKKGADETYSLGDMYKKITDTHKRFDKSRIKDMQNYFGNDPELNAFLKGKKRVTQIELLEFIDLKCSH